MTRRVGTDQPALRLLSEEMRRCVETCLECHVTCLAPARHGLQRGGAVASDEHIRLLLDCAEVCHLCVVLRHSAEDLQAEVCRICAEYCDRVAEACERLGDDNEQLRLCGEVCRRGRLHTAA